MMNKILDQNKTAIETVNKSLPKGTCETESMLKKKRKRLETQSKVLFTTYRPS